MRVSVIIPTYNSEGTIRQTLEAVLNQDFKDYEVIVVDDGSKDNTCKIVKGYPVRLVKHRHKGPAAARNLGARTAESDILLFIDADCIPERNWIEEMIRPFEEDDIVGVQGRYKTRQSEIVARFAQYEIEDRYERMLKHKYIDFIGSYSAAYRKDIFLNEGGFDESFTIASGEDPDLSFRLASKGYKMIFNPKAGVFHRHPNSFFEYSRQKFYRAFWRIPLYRKNYKKTIEDSYTPQLLKVQILLFYLLVLFLLAAIFLKSLFGLYLSFIMFTMLISSTLPLSAKIIRKDKKVGLISPLLIILRTLGFGFGLVLGLLKKTLG